MTLDINLNYIATNLFNKLKTRFPEIKLAGADGKIIDADNPANARFFEVKCEFNKIPLGIVTIRLTDDSADNTEKRSLIVIFSKDLKFNKSAYIKEEWFNFLRALRKFAKQNGLKFDVRDISKTNLDKRDFQFLARNSGEKQMNENKSWKTSKTSYQQVGESKLIIRHSRPVNVNENSNRVVNVESIYIENSLGERFRYPLIHLNGARAMAEHLNHGGNPYDQIGQYIVNLSEELKQLRKFKGYVSRNENLSEAMGDITNKVIERINEVKKEIQHLQRPGYYQTFSENFIGIQRKEIPDDLLNDWIDRLTIRTFNEELKNVFPYLYNLIDESSLPIKEINPLELISNESDEYRRSSSSLREIDYYESFLDSLSENTGLYSSDEDAQQQAIEKLNDLFSAPREVGTGATFTTALKGIIDDPKLDDIFTELADIAPTFDALKILKDYIVIKDQEKGTDLASKINFGVAADDNEEPVPAEEPVPGEEPMPAEEPVPGEEPMPAEEPAAPGMPPEQQQKFAETVKKALSVGMTLEDSISAGKRSLTLRDAIYEAGLDIKEYETPENREVIEFIESMYNAEEGNFPRGEQGVLIACEKRFGEQVIPYVEETIKRLSPSYSPQNNALIDEDELMSASISVQEQVELVRLKKLSGLA